MRNIVVLIACCIAAFVAGCYHGNGIKVTEMQSDTIIRIDTFTDYKPLVRDSIVLKEVVRKFPIYYSVHDTMSDTIVRVDSVSVAVPITQKKYEGDDYKAWVSGYEPSLDSIDVYRKTETITIRERQRRWGIGVVGGVGYGITSRKVEPFVGVGVTYRLY